MRKFFILFFLILFGLSLVSAFNFDKSKLYFDLEVGEETCQIITFSEVSGELSVRNVWAETFDEEGNLNSYDYSAGEHGLSITSGFEDASEFEVCLSGSEIGEYKGLLIFTPAAETNVVVEKGVWLFVEISEPVVEEVVSDSGGSSSSLGDTGGGGGGIQMIVEEKELEPEMVKRVEIREEEKEEVNSGFFGGITGAVVGADGSKGGLIALGVVVLIGMIVFYNYRRKK